MATDEPFEDGPAEDLLEVDDELPEEELIEDALDVDTREVDDVDTEEVDDVESESNTAEAEDEAFDELEAEELEMLTEDETTETLVVDEAAEMRAIRRAELAMDQQGVVEASDGEFVCSNCFLVLKTSQLANPRKRICKDCAG